MDNFSSCLKLYILITISNVFTKDKAAVTAVWLFKFEVTELTHCPVKCCCKSNDAVTQTA